jgi:hypothetical protein
MAILNIPAGLLIRTANWRQEGGIVYNRSEFTGRTQGLRIGPAGRWACDFEIVPARTQAGVNTVRAFLAQLYNPADSFRLSPADVQQVAGTVPATCLVNGANQLGFTLACDGVPNSIPILTAGQFISVALPNGDEQLLQLTANATSITLGRVTFTFSTPLRAAPADNATVRLHFPSANMRIENPSSWDVSPGLIYTYPSFTATEFF